MAKANEKVRRADRAWTTTQLAQGAGRHLPPAVHAAPAGGDAPAAERKDDWRRRGARLRGSRPSSASASWSPREVAGERRQRGAATQDADRRRRQQQDGQDGGRLRRAPPAPPAVPQDHSDDEALQGARPEQRGAAGRRGPHRGDAPALEGEALADRRDDDPRQRGRHRPARDRRAGRGDAGAAGCLPSPLRRRQPRRRPLPPSRKHRQPRLRPRRRSRSDRCRSRG